jgi:light-regulated signal transduction histidine kinase (bacteriophytochrome)
MRPLPVRVRAHILGYAGAILAVALACAVTFGILRTVGPNVAIGYAFLFAIMGAAWWGGYGPGLLVLFLSFFAVPYLFLPRFSLSRIDLNRLALTALVSLLISRVASTRRQAEAALRRANEELEARVQNRTAALERQNQALQRVAYIASHDLQEPLRTICAFSQLVVARYSDKLDKAGVECLNHAANGALRMQQLVNDLLCYSRTVNDTSQPALTPVSVVSALVDAKHSLALAIVESSAVITHDDDLAWVLADPVQFAQVFQNLLSNAIKYRSPERPLRIDISSSRTPDGVRISVKDNGIGLDMMYAERIFEAFRRLHGPDVPGSGIGLALCKNIIESCGGRIWVNGSPGAGAEFCFTLHAAPDNQPAQVFAQV